MEIRECSASGILVGFFFDVHVVDTYAASYDGVNPHKFLYQHERRKKGEYLEACLDILWPFMPPVFSVDRVMGGDTKLSTKQLDFALLNKWNREYSEI